MLPQLPPYPILVLMFLRTEAKWRPPPLLGEKGVWPPFMRRKLVQTLHEFWLTQLFLSVRGRDT
jgi:hypothetical protein